MAKPTIEDEVLGNIRRLPLGPPDAPAGTVADLNLPLDFLRRVADRVVQASFRERWRVVVGEGVEHAAPAPVPPATPPGWVQVIPSRPPAPFDWIECRPPLRGFRAPILGGPAWPFSGSVDATLTKAAALVNSRLAIDGIDRTCEQVEKLLSLKPIRALSSPDGRARFLDPQEPSTAAVWNDVVSRVKSAGLPVDLAGYITAGPPNFAARAENDPHPPSALRLQLTGPGYYAGPGDGGSLDIARQLIEHCDGMTVYLSVDERHAPSILGHLTTWSPARNVRAILIPESLPVAQWARDNAIGGVRVRPDLPSVHDAGRPFEPMLLAPRWAGRGEEGGIFIPGETLIAEGLAAAGLKVGQSGLLFEGGNLILVNDGAKRILLIGEAELWRNTALGLSRDEVIRAFQRELGADDTAILPASSFHIDLEVTVSPPIAQSRCTAFVLETMPAVRTIARLAAARLAETGLVTASEAAACANPKATFASLAEPLRRALAYAEVGPGRYPFEFATLFRSGPMDSGIGNLKRVLFALDWLLAELNLAQAADTHYAAHLRALRRQEKDRAAIARRLTQLGWNLIRVPGISSESESLNPINGLWLGSAPDGQPRFLMTTYGGFFSTLDEAALDIYRRSGVQVTPIQTAETQRRGGGLHCAVGVL